MKAFWQRWGWLAQVLLVVLFFVALVWAGIDHFRERRNQPVTIGVPVEPTFCPDLLPQEVSGIRDDARLMTVQTTPGHLVIAVYQVPVGEVELARGGLLSVLSVPMTDTLQLCDGSGVLVTPGDWR